MEKIKTKTLNYIEVLPKETTPIASIIWLHGLGADGNDFVPIAEALDIPKKDKIRFIFPTAPLREITINNGEVMNGWYDIKNLNRIENEDEAGIKESNQLIKSLIEQEINNGVPEEKIILAGFSQGGALATYTALRLPYKIAALISLSSYCILEKDYDNLTLEFKNLPTFIGHGIFDPVVPLHLGERTKEILATNGCNVDFKTYPIQHSVSEEEINDLSLFIKNTLNLES